MLLALALPAFPGVEGRLRAWLAGLFFGEVEGIMGGVSTCEWVYGFMGYGIWVRGRGRGKGKGRVSRTLT